MVDEKREGKQYSTRHSTNMWRQLVSKQCVYAGRTRLSLDHSRLLPSDNARSARFIRRAAGKKPNSSLDGCVSHPELSQCQCATLGRPTTAVIHVINGKLHVTMLQMRLDIQLYQLRVKHLITLRSHLLTLSRVYKNKNSNDSTFNQQVLIVRIDCLISIIWIVRILSSYFCL